jgi:outer membrane autotransporter protein
MNRAIGFSDYLRTSRSDWIGFAGAANVGAGYERRVGAVAFGPIAGLDYTYLSRPRIKEYDGGGTRLTLDAASYNSLRSGLGAQARLEHPFSERRLFKMEASAQWMHELLDPTRTVRAAFTGYEGRKFDTKLTSAVDSLLVQGNMALVFDSNFKLSLNAGTELFRAGYESLQGGVSASWSF